MVLWGGGGIPCLGKSESTNSGATNPVPFLQQERTNYAGLAKIIHEKQWTVSLISWCINQNSCLHPMECHRNTTIRRDHFSTSGGIIHGRTSVSQILCEIFVRNLFGVLKIFSGTRSAVLLLTCTMPKGMVMGIRITWKIAAPVTGRDRLACLV